MSDPIIPEPGSLTAPEAKALIEAAEKVVRVAADYLNAFEKKPLRDAIAELATVLRHVTPEPTATPDDENKPAPLPWWTPEDVRAKMEGTR